MLTAALQTSRSSPEHSVNRMQALSKIEFKIPSKVTGDHNEESFALTPNIDSESELDEYKPSENVTPFAKCRMVLKSRQSPQPSVMFAVKVK